MAPIERGDWWWALLLFGARQHRRQRRLRLLRRAPAPRRPPRRGRSGLDRRLRARLLRRRPPARDRRAVIVKPALFGLDAKTAAIQRRLHRHRVVGGVRDPAVPRRARAGAAGGRAGRGGSVIRAAFSDLRRTLRASCAATARRCTAGRLPHLQRRHRHHHPHGDHLRRRAAEIETASADHRAGAGAVRRHPGDLRVRRDRRAQSAPAPPSSCGLAVYVVVSVYGYFLTTATDFFILAVLVGLVQGGTQALSRSLFAIDDPARSLQRVLRPVRGVREVRRHRRPAIFAVARPLRLEPPRDPLDHRASSSSAATCCTRVDVAAGRAAAAELNRRPPSTPAS